MARIHNSDYRVRCHRSRGYSGQGEAERTNSAIADGLVDGATLEWGKFKRFEYLTEEEIQVMYLKMHEEYERERMAKIVWYVCRQVSGRIEDAPVPKEYIQSRVSELPICRFTVTHQKKNKIKVPVSAYFNKIERFIELHYIRGELFMEFCRDACKERVKF